MSGKQPIEFHQRWARLKPPLSPDAQIAAKYREAIHGREEHVLLLGVTPTLADIGLNITAVDFNDRAIANLWPGDTERRTAIHGNWFDLPFRDRKFTAVIGDGVLAAIKLDQYPALFGQLEKVLVPGGRIVLRLFETPEPGEDIAHVRDAALSGRIEGFHAFKWRLAMALATQSKNSEVPVVAIFEAFAQAFPDREVLSAATGWSLRDISEIDAYDGNKIVLKFPTHPELLAHLPPQISARFQPSGEYELAERCPFLISEIVS